jgi:serine/threonine protein kinase/Tfp pilus assembly protein PilF
MIGKTISHYKIIEKLGSGGMGVVYKAEDLKLKRFVALKFLPPELTRDPDAKARFLHEAQAASALQHSNICTIHEIDETGDDRIYICMDYYHGETLREKIDRGPLETDDVVDIGLQMARGLAAAQEAQEVHRDIKPANVMITDKGEVKLVDFGLAKLARQTRLTTEGTTLGTVAYMSPEQSQGEDTDQRTDIWSLGVVLYEMISGKAPFKGDYDQATVYSILNEAPQALTALRTGVPLELERIINKALNKDPDERYQHVDDLLVDLKGLRKTSDSTSGLQTPSVPPVKTRKKPGKKYIIPFVTIIFIIIAYIFLKPFIDEEIAIADPKPIVVISFKNQTGEAKYDYLQEAIPNLLITNLEQSKYIRVITWERIQDLLKQMGRSNVNIIDREIGFEICRMEGIEAIVLGSFIKAGDVFATDVKILDVHSKLLLNSASARGEGVSSILQNQIDELSREISRGINIAETRIKKTKLKISDVTTKSMESYHNFIRGRDAYEKLYYEDAEEFLTKAIHLDSTFALAHLYLARTNSALRQYEARDASIERAKIFAKDVGEKDRMYINTSYAGYIEKNPEKRLNILEKMAERFPREKYVFMDLGWYYRGRKEYTTAISEFNRALELDPNYAEIYNGLAYLYGDMKQFDKADECLRSYSNLVPGDANPYDSMAEFYLRTGRIEKAIDKYKEALEVKPDFGSEKLLGWLYATKEDYLAAITWEEKYVLNTQTASRRILGNLYLGLFLYHAGNPQMALRKIDDVKNTATNFNLRWGVAFYHYFRAWFAMDLGNPEQAKKSFKLYYNYRVEQRPQYLPNHKADFAFRLGLVYLLQMKTDSARIKLQEMKTLFPDLTPIAKERHLWCQYFLNTNLLISEDSLKKAVQLKNMKITLDRPFSFNLNYLEYNFPLTQDFLAQAYVKKGLTGPAIKEYEYLLETDPFKREHRIINPRYHYKLAKLYQQIGEAEKAIEQYSRFLEIWQNADQDLSEYIDSKRQLAVLKASS